MTRPRTPAPFPGVAAKYPPDCPLCPNGIEVGARVVFRRGAPVHAACHAEAHQ